MRLLLQQTFPQSDEMKMNEVIASSRSDCIAAATKHNRILSTESKNQARSWLLDLPSSTMIVVAYQAVIAVPIFGSH